MNLRFEYETYQQVRTNLKTAFFLLLAAGALFFGLAGPDAWRAPFVALLPLDLSKLESLVQVITALLVVPAILAFVAVEGVGIHDLYDRHVVRWRERFDIDFILPRLYMPFAERMDRRFLDVAEQNRRDCMERLFYPFVRDGQPLIHPNLVRRFWEAMTWYWVAQLFELVLIFTLVVLLVVPVLVSLTPTERERAQFALIGTFLLLLLNRYWIRNRRASVRRRTTDEVAEIVTQHGADLEKRMKDLVQSYQIENQL